MSIEISRVRALCFDVDGTLNDIDDQFVSQLMNWLRPFKILFPQKDPRSFARKLVMFTETPANYLFCVPDRLGIDDEISAFGDFLYRAGLGKKAKPFALIHGVKEMLDELKGRYPLSIVSARGERSTRMFVEQFGLESFFECIVTAQTCAHTKPYPDPVLWAAKHMEVSPEACLMIGDTTVDMRAGKAAGTQTVGVLCGFGTANELIRAGADAILPTTSLLSAALLSGNWPEAC